MNRNFALIAAVLMITACEPVSDSASCVLGDKNYLLDADFALEAKSPQSRHWAGIQHAGEDSFTVSISDAVVSVEKTGPQDWYIYRQKLESADFSGREMAFSAEMKLVGQTGDSTGRLAKPGGLVLKALSSSGKILMRVEQRLEAGSQLDEWQQVQLIARLPLHTERVELGFHHKSDGVLQARDPAFRQVDSASAACALTPIQ